LFLIYKYICINYLYLTKKINEKLITTIDAFTNYILFSDLDTDDGEYSLEEITEIYKSVLSEK